MWIATLALVGAVAAGPAAENDMDFWVGEWTCTGRSLGPDGKWSKTDATNSIVKAMNGKVLHERFAMGEYRGESWSVWSPAQKAWQQTWVDNQGSYIALRGGKSKDGIILTTLPNPAKPGQQNRMEFSDIKKDAFVWRWKETRDGGKSWTLRWELNYKRRG